MTHDLKNHLSPIRMCAEMLESHVPGPLNEKQERMVGTIHRCVDKLESLIRDISDAYKLELHSLEFSKTELEMQSLMDGCAVLLQPLIVGKQIELKMEVEVNGLIYADKNRIEQVIVNLVKNSIDFVPESDGKITIVVKKDESSNLLFFVKDNGEGIKSEDFGKIFTKFYKGVCKQPRIYGGSGLGLAICKGIVEAHGGKIWVDPMLPNGSIFKFTIPMRCPMTLCLS
ncbi:MAG TPA: HAMP domain-containing sensor histidine kinase [Candidatus Nitrosotalea sp.]|nr:HAMP domain-containing sensor histidine kinase [Candidatus Nitrosotalea sp.]